MPEQDKDDVKAIVDSLDGAFKRLFKNYKNMSKLRRLKETLAKLLQEFGNVTTDKGVLSWDGEEDLKEGDLVYVEDSEGKRTPAADGDYKTDDNKVIVVVDGKVSEIKDAEAEVDSEFIETDKGKLVWDNEEEDLKAGDEVYIEDEDGNRTPAPDGDYTTEDGKVIKVADGKVTEIVDDKAEVAPEMDETEDRIQELEERIKELEEENAALKAENASLKENLAKMKKTPAAKPAHQEVKAKRISKFNKIKQAFAESFDTKMREISNAIAAVIGTENFM